MEKPVCWYCCNTAAVVSARGNTEDTLPYLLHGIVKAKSTEGHNIITVSFALRYIHMIRILRIMRQNQDINDLIVQMVVCKSVIQKQQIIILHLQHD